MVLLAAPNYALRLGGSVVGLEPDAFFRYSTAIGVITIDAILLIVVLLIARGLPLRETFALRAPRSWRRAAATGVVTVIAAYGIAFLAAALVPGAGTEQGVPELWDPTRVGAWVANLFAIAIFAPIFEEALCRGLGYALFEPLGTWAAIFITAGAFTLAHGVIVDAPVILATGLALGYLRGSTGSIFPSVLFHGFFNGFALVIAALVARG